MPFREQSSFLDLMFLVPYLRLGILLILLFYVIFALVIFRQVDLMSRTLITPLSPVIKAISVIHAGFALGLITLVFVIL